MKRLFYLLGIILGLQVTAQTEMSTPVSPIVRYVEGYVITNEGDTLTGEVRVRNKGITYFVNRIHFKPESGKKVDYFPEDLKGFVQKRDNLSVLGGNSLQSSDQEWIYYDSFTHPSKKNKTVFVQRLLKGPKMTLYENPSGSSTSTGLGGITVSESERTYLISKEGGELIRLHKGQFENRLEELFYDCISLKTELENNEKMKDFRNIEDIVIKYNECD